MNTCASSPPTEAFLRWAGSKRQLIPKLMSFWKPEYNRYIEPFAGSAAFFYKLAPNNAILGDINNELISTYQQIRDNLDSVLASIHSLGTGKQFYLDLRAVDPYTISEPERAARFIFLNRYCFNGLYRTNLEGKFNVPYGGGQGKSGQLPSDDHLKACSRLLKNATLINGNFDETLNYAKEGDFIYIDPPFSLKARRIFVEYDPSKFSWEAVEKLRNWLLELNRRSSKFLVSYAESEEADFLKAGFNFEIVSVRRNIAGFCSNRKSANEVLVYN